MEEESRFSNTSILPALPRDPVLEGPALGPVEDEGETRPGTWAAVDDDRRAVQLEDATSDGEAEAGAIPVLAARSEGGFARVVCDDCRAEYLVAFSCTRRGFCTSCAAKRAAIFAAQLREEILEPVGHAQWVFTIPKMLRPYFLHRRRLLGKLSQAAFATVRELMAQALGEDSAVRPGMVSVLQTATDVLEWSPHVHALVSRGAWDGSGR